jgi:hypothetical protein
MNMEKTAMEIAYDEIQKAIHEIYPAMEKEEDKQVASIAIATLLELKTRFEGLNLLETEKKQMDGMYDKGYSDATGEAIKEIHENYSPNK